MSLPAPVPEQHQALCARHVTAGAVAICARCGSYACTTCLRYGVRAIITDRPAYMLDLLDR